MPISPAGGLFTPLERMPRCFALYPAKRGTVQGFAAGLGPNIIPAGLDTTLGSESQ
jgi:hypothetical protein